MHPTYFFNFNTHPFGWILFFPLLVLLAIWSLAWKGLALWRAARNGHRGWFVLLLIVNTVGILEIIYLYTAGRSKSSSQV